MRAVYIAYPTSLMLQSANATQTHHTARELRALDPSVVVLIPRLPGRASAFEAIGAIHLPRLPFNVLNNVVRTTLWSYLERSWFAWVCAVWLAWQGLTGRETVIYIRDAIGAAWFGGLLRRLLGATLVYEVHDLEQWNPARARSRALTPLVRLLDSAAIRGSHRVVTLTHEFRRYLARVGLKREVATGVAPDAFDDAVFAPTDRVLAREALGLPADAFIAVYSGFTFSYRQVENLVAAWGRVRAEWPGALLCLVGGRPRELEALRRQAEALGLAHAIHFAGTLPAPRVVEHLAAADTLVIPGTVSGRNASPLKMFEYMAMRRPIVCVDLPALREVLGDDGACFVAPDDVPALAAGLLGIAREPCLAAALAERAVDRARTYTYRARASAVLAEMRRALEARS